jgi:pimeloyl-ACP methyl ester carboxylesterase
VSAKALGAEQARVLGKGPFPDYPFTPKSFVQPNGLSQSYLDEGSGDPIVMLHGNPSWSYYWRKLVLGLRDRYRCIVPDHIGMGLSDKPDDDGPAATAHYNYTLQSRIDDLERLLDSLQLGDNITLAVHDWGGMIGFGWALAHTARVKRLVVLNTSSFPLPAAKAMPWQLRLGRDSLLGAGLIRGFNAFADGATRFGVTKKMSPAVRDAYNAPYDSWANRISTLRFVQDIPLSAKDRAWPLVESAGQRLPSYANRPVFIGWGLQDFVFDKHFLEGFQRALPNAEQHVFADAGHYVLEDKAEVVVPAIRAFLDRHPI